MSNQTGGAPGRPFDIGQACPICEEGKLALVRQPVNFEYKGHHLSIPVERFECAECHETFVDDVSGNAVDPILRRWYREVDGLLMPEEVRAIRLQLGVAQRQMAAVVGGGVKAFAKYETGVVNQSQGLDALLRTIRRRPDTFYRLARQRGIRVGLEPISLLLVWKSRETRGRYVVGHLAREGRGGYRFKYEVRKPRSVDEAIQAGFRLLEAFPDVSREYASQELFHLFDRRLPAVEVREEYFERFGLTVEQDLEYLRMTGGRLDTDTLELLEPIDEAQPGEYSVTFPIAGWRYYNGEREIGNLREGTVLRLEFESENPHDANAVRIMSPSGEKLGFVPAIYAWYIDESILRDGYVAKVHRIGPQEDPQIRVVVTLRVKKSTLPHVRLPSVVTDYGELLTV